jgi:DNA replication protein DnaC
MTRNKPPKIDQALHSLIENTSKANTQTSSSTDLTLARNHDLPGDPACPKCHGVGYLRADLPVGHPDFGRMQVCDCRAAQVSQQVRQRLFELSHLDELSHLTFGNFKPRGHFDLPPRQADTLEAAYNHAQQFAQHLEGWLVLQGGLGCGKTHLAAAIANFAVSIGVPSLFITVPDLLDSLRFTFNDPAASFEERFEQIRSAPLLVMDDFGTQKTSTWAQEKLFQIINYRYINRLPLVLTTNLSDEDFEERIRSRLQDRELVSRVRILAPDYRNPGGDFGHPQMSSLDLLHNRTFSSFELRKNEGLDPEAVRSLEKAYQAAREFAENPHGWLVILGSYATGKTHLAAAIGLYRSELGDPPLFMTITDLLDHLRATFNSNSDISLDKVFQEVRTTPLLILDDLNTRSSSEWVKEKLYQLFNDRYDAALPTVITSAETLEQMDPRIRSRMLDKRLCRIYAITVPSYTGAAPARSKPARRTIAK